MKLEHVKQHLEAALSILKEPPAVRTEDDMVVCGAVAISAEERTVSRLTGQTAPQFIVEVVVVLPGGFDAPDDIDVNEIGAYPTAPIAALAAAEIIVNERMQQASARVEFDLPE